MNLSRHIFVGRQREMAELTNALEGAVQKFMFLASGRADALSGRSIAVTDDEDLLLERINEIQQDDLYTLRLRRF